MTKNILIDRQKKKIHKKPKQTKMGGFTFVLTHLFNMWYIYVGEGEEGVDLRAMAVGSL